MLLQRLLFFWSIYALSISLSSAQEDDYRLPKNVKPIRYNLTMAPNFENKTFTGTVIIEIKALEHSNHITLHAHELNMPPKEHIIVQELETGKIVTVESAEYTNTIYEYFKISLSEMLIEGTTYVIHIPNFNAILNKDPVGFSSGTFTESDGSKRYFAFTQFEPTDARRAFPCFDEPGLRAKFNIRLVRPNKQFISASNSRLISQNSTAPFIDIYEETVDMPTYLVAFTISEMQFSETLDRYRIIARPEALKNNQHEYGLNMTAKSVDFMETYTRVPFALPKLDELAVVKFGGGMENWGLMVYGERFLLTLYESEKSTILSVVAHETAHQWFGNLIGLTWWEHIWLSEGFATYFQNLISHQIEPSIDNRGSFLFDMQAVLQDDMKLNAQTLTQNAKTPTEIFLLFGSISYKKGGAVLHMLENALTTSVFQQGLEYYVRNILGYPDCLNKSLSVWKYWIKSKKRVSEMKNYILCGAIQAGTQNDFEYLLSVLKNTDNYPNNIIEGLSCSKNIKNLYKLLQLNNKIPIDKIVETVMYSGPEGLQTAVNFVVKNFAMIEEKLERKSGSLLRKISDSISTNYQLNTVKMLLQRLLFFWSIYALSISLSSAQEDDYRLPKNVKPIRYNLTMAPNFENKTFTGTVIIEIKALEHSNHITLHAHELNMPPKEHIIVQELETGKIVTVESAEYTNTVYEYYKMSLSEMLIKGSTYVIRIPNFNGILNKDPVGFSSGTFTESDGSKRYFAFTQFEPTDARRAFPCFDEPGLRAKFNIRLVRPNKQFISASNSRLISQSSTTPFIDTYEETVDMPTYLVAFTISEMQFSETLDRYRIIARPEALKNNHHEYGLNMTAKSVDFMETYTRVPFALPKLDELAVTKFGGGMENWGLIVYGERFLLTLYESEKSTILSVVAHEIAHQWFGNLIGLTWWEHIWLSEGFATYFQNLISHQIEPSIDNRGSFLFDMQAVFQDDMKLNAQTLTQNAKTPTEIFLLFGSISYKKGGAVLHMVENVLTTSVFQQGLEYYVRNMQFKQATPAELYKNLQKAVDENVNTLADLTVAEFMASWETVKGFPVVDVRRNYGLNSNIVELTQTRYISKPVGEDGHWIIPINFATSNNLTFENTRPEYWMKETRQTISLPYLVSNSWLIANKKKTGYYRVNYDETNWNLIIKTLMTSHLDIHVLNRAQLVDDSINLAKTGRLNYSIAKNLVAYLHHEEDPIPWQSVYTNNIKLEPMFYYSTNYHIFKKYNFNLTNSIYKYLGFEEQVHETNLKKNLRNITLNMLCRIGYPDCLNKSLSVWKYWIKTKKNVSELKSYILCGAIQAGTQNDFQYLLSVLRNTDSDPTNIIKGLSCSKNIKNLYKLLKLNDKIAMDEMIETIMSSGPEGLQTVVNFVAKNFAVIEEKLERKTGLLLRKITESISTNYQLNKLKQAIGSSKHAEVFMELFDTSEKNIDWKKHKKINAINKLIYFGLLNQIDRFDKMLLRRLIFCWLTFELGISISCAQDEIGYQLPKNIKPIRYNLTIIPNFITDTFSGTVLIEFKVLETSNHITLHAFDLSMPAKEDISVRELNTNITLTVQSAECVNLVYQYFKISLLETLIKDTSYVLTIPNFSKTFDKIRFGFVSGTFTENDGSSHYFSYTQFQPTDARRVFPCFDEPALRAKFNIQLVRPSKQFISASNGRLFAPFIDTYEETLDMPTYLVAFTISEMRFSEKLRRYRIIARPESLCKNEHRYGLNLTAAVVDFMETYTRVPFVLPKLDAVAISGFSGGMENWGLIVYGELFLLLNDKTDKAQIASAVAHEVTHQWFGDLIGLSWWDYLWLSEGLTSYVQSIVIAQVEPSVDSRGRYILSMQSAFQVDMMLDTRPLTQNVQTPMQISSLFDVITYMKGGSLFKMLEAALTAPILQLGLQYYAANMQFKSATPSELYQNIQKAVDENVSTLPQLLTVADFMASWETVQGYPVVDVRRVYGTNIIDLTQKATGYYRVNYDETNWNLIIQTLMTNHLNIHVLNRAQLIDDSLNLAKTNYLSYDIAIKLVSYINREKDPIPWSTYTTNILKLKPMLYHLSYYNIFKEYNFNIMKTVYEYVGFEAKVGESDLLKDLRTIILNMLCELGHQNCLNKSLNKFKQWINTKKDLSKLERYTLCGAIRAGNQEDFDYLFNIITNTHDPAVNIIKGLSCTKNINNLHKLLQLNDKIAMDEMIEIVMDSGPEGLQTTINFVVQNFEIINARLERKLESLLRKISELVSSHYQLNKLKQASDSKKLFATAEKNIEWRKHNLKKVAEKLKIYGVLV
ncbi:hypothetical protein RN001_006674 [Aquatica leii]|uniref:Aminopeptidase N n=1 Tax=Aquatica leii TaxID=1421715 RepID=A0AAN7Q904_9COLE|nr:hypothetical protein RN001_006674 [Aquatica leii]